MLKFRFDRHITSLISEGRGCGFNFAFILSKILVKELSELEVPCLIVFCSLLFLSLP